MNIWPDEPVPELVKGGRRWEDGKMGRWENGKMGKWEDAKIRRWGDVENWMP
ncbi:MAG: hypothetical protein M0R39_09490 [Prolixibacteraceae bacterium]|nr:hypothetical protein [Prolixibacteraceae bacterium]